HPVGDSRGAAPSRALLRTRQSRPAATAAPALPRYLDANSHLHRAVRAWFGQARSSARYVAARRRPARCCHRRRGLTMRRRIANRCAGLLVCARTDGRLLVRLLGWRVVLRILKHVVPIRTLAGWMS